MKIEASGKGKWILIFFNKLHKASENMLVNLPPSYPQGGGGGEGGRYLNVYFAL